jgi:hypothetical protein
MSVTLSKTYFFTVDLGTAIHNLTTATLKLAFTNTAPTTATHVYADIVSPLALTNMATSPALASVTYTQTTGTATLSAATWTGTSQTGTFGPFRYVVIYNDSATNKNVIGWYDYGSALSLNGVNGDQFVVTFPSGILTNS